MITIKTFVEGPIDANNYLVIDEESKEAVLIDCSSSRAEFIQAIKDSGVNLKQILLTHGHFDHLLGVEGFKEALGVDAYISEDDMNQVKLMPDMLQMFLGMMGCKTPNMAGFIKDGDIIKIGNTEIKAIATPGHTKGGMCYLVEDKLFSGDTLFQGSCGRCDLPEGDFGTIVKSIKDRLFTLPEEIEVFPGHGPKTTIAHEKKFNDIINY